MHAGASARSVACAFWRCTHRHADAKPTTTRRICSAGSLRATGRACAPTCKRWRLCWTRRAEDDSSARRRARRTRSRAHRCYQCGSYVFHARRMRQSTTQLSLRARRRLRTTPQTAPWSSHQPTGCRCPAACSPRSAGARQPHATRRQLRVGTHQVPEAAQRVEHDGERKPELERHDHGGAAAQA